MSDGAARTTLRGTLRRLPRSAVIVVVVVVIPAGIGAFLGGTVGAAALVAGVLVGYLGSAARGWRRARTWMPIMSAAFLLGGWTTQSWWWVVATTAVAAVAGFSVRAGLFVLLVNACLLVLVAPPITSAQEAVAALLLVNAGGFLGTLLARRTGIEPSAVHQGTDVRTAVLVAVSLGLAIGFTSTLAFLTGDEHGFWMPLTVLVLAQPSPSGRWTRTKHRLIGTLLGFAACLPLAIVSVPPPVAWGLAFVALTLAVTVRHPYWLSVMFLTMTIVLGLAPAGQAIEVAQLRLWETAVGCAVVAVTAWAMAHFVRQDEVPSRSPTRHLRSEGAGDVVRDSSP